MQLGDIEPPDLESSAVLRKIRVEAINDFIQLSGPKDVLESFKYHRNIGINKIYQFPFGVTYSTEDQKQLYKDICTVVSRPTIIIVDYINILIPQEAFASRST